MLENIELFQEFESLISSRKDLDQNIDTPCFRNYFYIPFEGKKVTPYLCGHSLGLQPKSVQTFVNQELESWKNFGVEAHFHSKNPWYTYHKNLTPTLATLCGAFPHEVV